MRKSFLISLATVSSVALIGCGTSYDDSLKENYKITFEPKIVTGGEYAVNDILIESDLHKYFGLRDKIKVDCMDSNGIPINNYLSSDTTGLDDNLGMIKLAIEVNPSKLKNNNVTCSVRSTDSYTIVDSIPIIFNEKNYSKEFLLQLDEGQLFKEVKVGETIKIYPNAIEYTVKDIDPRTNIGSIVFVDADIDTPIFTHLSIEGLKSNEVFFNTGVGGRPVDANKKEYRNSDANGINSVITIKGNNPAKGLELVFHHNTEVSARYKFDVVEGSK